MGKSNVWRYINSKEKGELDWLCIILMKVLNNLRIVALSTPYNESIHFISQQKTQFLKNMMEDSKILSKEFTNKNISSFSRLKKSGMSIV